MTEAHGTRTKKLSTSCLHVLFPCTCEMSVQQHSYYVKHEEEEEIYMLLPANKSDRMHWVKSN